MTEFTLKDGTKLDAFRVYGAEERDAHSMNILVENVKINDRYVVSRAEFARISPKENHYLIIDKDGKASFKTNVEFSDMLDNDVQPEDKTLKLKITSGVSATNGTPTSDLAAA